jgi:phosphoribosylanthranilate isomerase
MTVQVKICGVTSVEDACAAARFGADMVGVNFYPKSPRSVTLGRAREIRAALGGECRLVGVFVNATHARVERVRVEAGLDLLQFHGDESDEFIGGWPLPVIRALRLKPGAVPDFARVPADYVLVDTFHPGLYGGTGMGRPLTELHGLNLSRVFISGGLNPDNVGEAVALAPYAVDTASGVESSPGVKDHDKIRRFIENAKCSR